MPPTLAIGKTCYIEIPAADIVRAGLLQTGDASRRAHLLDGDLGAALT